MFKRSNLLFSSKLGQSCWDTMGETLDRSLRLEPLFGQHQFWSWWKLNYFWIGQRTQDSCKLRHVFGVCFLINTLLPNRYVFNDISKFYFPIQNHDKNWFRLISLLEAPIWRIPGYLPLYYGWSQRWHRQRRQRRRRRRRSWPTTSTTRNFANSGFTLFRYQSMIWSFLDRAVFQKCHHENVNHLLDYSHGN